MLNLQLYSVMKTKRLFLLFDKFLKQNKFELCKTNKKSSYIEKIKKNLPDVLSNIRPLHSERPEKYYIDR